MSDLNEDLVRDALRQVMDPEAGMNVVDLGLVYGISIGERSVHVQMTMTSAACPMADMIVDDAYGAIEGALPRGQEIEVEVELVWEPPWTPEMMTDLARDRFGWAPR
jgi:metal-sulfur cluster biosynthetic enzyme